MPSRGGCIFHPRRNIETLKTAKLRNRESITRAETLVLERAETLVLER